MMDTVGIDKFAVMECMLNSGGLEDDVTNTMLEKMVLTRMRFYFKPSVLYLSIYRWSVGHSLVACFYRPQASTSILVC